MKHTYPKLAAALALAFASASVSQAGPYILAGTDADDHGFFSGGNQDGWFFMQRALENLAPQVTNGNKQVVFLGTDVGSTAGDAASSAFTNSSLPGAGWTSTFLNNAAVNTFLSGGLSGAGIVVMDSAYNVTGGANSTEVGYFTSNASNINSFLGGGGGLFSQANDYGWVGALLPSLVVTPFGGSDALSLTALGQSAFPGLTNSDLSSGPYHNIFTNPAGVPILATNSAGQAVIIGASGGTVTNPGGGNNVPDSGNTAMFLAIAGMVFLLRRMFARALA